MLKYCVRKWDENKDELEEALRHDTHLNSCDYKYLVKLVVRHILNDGESGYNTWDDNNITMIDNGSYQGTQLFMIPKDTYQPCAYEYLITYQYYGSCSGCDSLQAIQDWSDVEPTERQVKDFMTICRDLICNIQKPYHGYDDEKYGFEEMEY